MCACEWRELVCVWVSVLTCRCVYVCVAYMNVCLCMRGNVHVGAVCEYICMLGCLWTAFALIACVYAYVQGCVWKCAYMSQGVSVCAYMVRVHAGLSSKINK